MMAAAASVRVTVKMEFLRMVNLVSLLMNARLHSRDRVLTKCGLKDDQLVIEAT